MTNATTYAFDETTGPVLAQLTEGLRSILRDQLVGLYLYGSLITGDFDPHVSDIDLVVVMSSELDAARFNSLHQLHQRVVERRPEWHDRLELAYISQAALRAFRSSTSTIGIISPGEPFHLLEAGSDWLISWYALRQDGVALLGPPIKALIDDIPRHDYLQAVDEHIRRYRHSVKKPHDKCAHAYIVLTVARGLYTLCHGLPTSKIKAAAWAQQRYPHWAELIARSLAWRANPQIAKLAPEQIRPEVAAYVRDMLANLPKLESCKEEDHRHEGSETRRPSRRSPRSEHGPR